MSEYGAIELGGGMMDPPVGPGPVPPEQVEAMMASFGNGDPTAEPSQPDDTLPGACPECGMPMEGNQCPSCGYSHETPIPPENLETPSMSAKVGIELGKVIQHIATQAVATPVTDPEALKGLGAAAKDFADALATVSPPPSTPDPTTLEKLAQQETDAERQAEQAEAQRQFDELKAEADHERTLEQTEQQQAMQAEQQAAQGPPSGQST